MPGDWLLVSGTRLDLTLVLSLLQFAQKDIEVLEATWQVWNHSNHRGGVMLRRNLSVGKHVCQKQRIT